jgi:hypothetical protein
MDSATWASLGPTGRHHAAAPDALVGANHQLAGARLVPRQPALFRQLEHGLELTEHASAGFVLACAQHLGTLHSQLDDPVVEALRGAGTGRGERCRLESPQGRRAASGARLREGLLRVARQADGTTEVVAIESMLGRAEQRGAALVLLRATLRGTHGNGRCLRRGGLGHRVLCPPALRHLGVGGLGRVGLLDGCLEGRQGTRAREAGVLVDAELERLDSARDERGALTVGVRAGRSGADRLGLLAPCLGQRLLGSHDLGRDGLGLASQLLVQAADPRLELVEAAQLRLATAQLPLLVAAATPSHHLGAFARGLRGHQVAGCVQPQGGQVGVELGALLIAVLVGLLGLAQMCLGLAHQIGRHGLQCRHVPVGEPGARVLQRLRLRRGCAARGHEHGRGGGGSEQRGAGTSSAKASHGTSPVDSSSL